MSNTLRNTDVLERVQGQLLKIHGLTQEVADTMYKIDGKVDTLDMKFDQILKNVKEAAKFDRQEMPSKPAIFYGREGLVDKLAMLVSSELASHMCLLGPGGMGKTSISLAIVESPLVQAKYPEERRVWVPCVEAISASLLLQVLYTSLRVKRQTESTMDDILYELKASKEPILLLLDNFETPWNTTDGSKKQVDNVLHKLNKLPHVSILITMRGSRPPTDDVTWHAETVPPTDKEACRRICLRVNSKWTRNDPHLDELLDALGCMPFAVTLMAHLGNETLSSPVDLLAEWQKTGTSMISPPGTPESNMNRSICLSVDSNLVKNDPNALHLLAALALLPAGTTRRNLHYWTPSLESESRAISILSRAALLQITTNPKNPTSQTLFVLPVVQSFMLHHNRIPDDIQQQVRSACCQYVLDHACRFRDASFKANVEALASEDTNIQSILVGDIESTGCDDQLVRALLAFIWYRRDTTPIIAVAEHTVNLARATGNNRYIAEALMCCGDSYSVVDNVIMARPRLEECAQLFKSLVDDETAQELGFECALAGSYVHAFLLDVDYKDRRAILDDLLAKTKDSNKYWHTRALRALGVLHMNFEDHKAALEAFVTAKDILLQLGYDKDAASALFRIAETLDLQRADDRAVLEAVQKAWKAAEPLTTSGLHGRIHLLSGQVLLRMHRYEDALHSFEKSLGAYEYVGGVLGVAYALDNIGYMYLQLGEFSDATAAYNAAVDKAASLGIDSVLGQKLAQRYIGGVEKIAQGQGNPDDEIGFSRPTTDRDHRELFFSTRQRNRTQ